MKCLIEKKCGSCKYINTDYQRQLKIKTDYCKKLLKDNKLDMYEVKDTIGMGHPYEYRNKIIVAFNHRYEFGFYEEDSHKIIPYDRCLQISAQNPPGKSHLLSDESNAQVPLTRQFCL